MERVERKMRPEITKAQDIIWDKFIDEGYAAKQAPIEEVTKSQEFIKTANQCREIDTSYLRGYLNLDIALDIDVDKDILLAKDGISQVVEHGNTKKYSRRASADLLGNIVLDHRLDDQNASQVLIHDLSHEFFHALAIREKRLAISPDRSTPTNIAIDYLVKAGYETHRGAEGELMVGFNEAVTERMTREAIEDYADSIPEDERLRILNHPANDGYTRERIVLNKIIAHASKTLQPDNPYAAELFWKDIARGVFLGTKMHLRGIEKAYGKGSLRILAAMHPHDPKQKSEKNNFKDDIFVRYFSPETIHAERDILSAQILNMKDVDEKGGNLIT